METEEKQKSGQALDRIAESVTDGRTENIRYRQQELFSLHHSLIEQASTICQALSRDGASETEAEAEYYLTVQAVRHFYDSLDFDKGLEDEYRVVNERNNEGRRVGFGMVVIRPTTHSRFYSIIVPVSAALAAGNSVVLELPQLNTGEREIDGILRSVLTRALNYNTFCVINNIEEDISKPDMDSPLVLLVDQTDDGRTSTSARHLVSPSKARTLAIVDRTADINEAARLIVRARFGFGGTSSYAPDLVLVNEFVKEKFLDACSRFSSLEFADVGTEKVTSIDAELEKLVREAEEKKEIENVGSSVFRVFEVLVRKSPLTKTKITTPCLLISTCTSLIDAISSSHDGKTPLLAGYFFADPRAAKYLAQHLPCQISCINQIPVHLLLGPAAPSITTPQPDFLYRYSTDTFSQPRPQFIEPVPSAFKVVDEYIGPLAKAEAGVSREKDSSRSKHLRALATKPLKPVRLPNNADIGFFESGLLITLGMFVLPVIGRGSYVLGRRILNKV